MPQNARTLMPNARKCGRANGKDTMARPRYQDGSLFIRGKCTKMWVARWREDVIQDNGALRWKRLDFLRATIEVAETFSDGQFGTPKTRSSRRVIPMSAALQEALAAHKLNCGSTKPDDPIFATSRGTPFSPKNLYNRVLAPACDRLGLPRVSWHSFRHVNATLLGEVGESVKTAQAILGHSHLETTLNTYMHAIPDSQRRAVERVAGVLFPDVPKSSPTSNEAGRVN